MLTHEEMSRTIVKATAEVFSTMLGLELEAGEAFTSQGDPGPTDGVVSLIGLAGEWVGSGSVSCTSEFACLASSHLLMSEYQAVNEEVLDAVAEITNMIIGNVKTQIEERFGPMGLSIPTVVYGLNFTTRSFGKNEWTVVPFRHGQHNLEIRICLAPNRDGHAGARAGIESPQTVQQ